MNTPTLTVSVISLLVASLSAQDAQRPNELLRRRYVEGTRLVYLMKGQNNAHTYEVRITATTVKKGDGTFAEEVAWSDSVSNGKPRALAATAQAFRLEVTLDGSQPFVMPDLSKVPGLIGPVLDLITFYADQYLAIHGGSLRQVGDRFLFQTDLVPSWADGTRVILGEDHIHLDVHLTAVDKAGGLATLLIKHVPPAEPKIRLPADWMRAPVATTHNNWVQIAKTPAGYAASIGRETFDVELTVSLDDGRIVSATMDNPVTAITRDCTDAALTQCGEPRSTPTLRQIQMALVRD